MLAGNQERIRAQVMFVVMVGELDGASVVINLSDTLRVSEKVMVGSVADAPRLCIFLHLLLMHLLQRLTSAPLTTPRSRKRLTTGPAVEYQAARPWRWMQSSDLGQGLT